VLASATAWALWTNRARLLSILGTRSSALAAPAPGTGSVSFVSAWFAEIVAYVRIVAGAPRERDYATRVGVRSLRGWAETVRFAPAFDAAAARRNRDRLAVSAASNRPTVAKAAVEALTILDANVGSRLAVDWETTASEVTANLLGGGRLSRGEVASFIQAAAPRVAPDLLPGNDASAPEPHLGSAFATLMGATLKLGDGALDRLSEDERRLLEYGTGAEVASALGETSADLQIRNVTTARIKKILSAQTARAAGAAVPLSERRESALRGASLLGYLHASGALLQIEAPAAANETADSAERKARAGHSEKSLFEMALYGRLSGAGYESTFADFHELFEAAYAAGQRTAREFVTPRVKTTTLSADEGSSSRRESSGPPSATLDVFHISALFDARRGEDAGRLLVRIGARARLQAEAAAEGRPVFADTIVAPAGFSDQDVRQALRDRLAAQPALRDSAAVVERYVASARVVSAPSGKISPDWMFGVLQGLFGLKNFTMNVYTTDASAWETASWRKDLSWKLFLVVSELEVVDVLNSLEQNLKAIQVLNVQA
jgi:hypothetical protein